MATNISSALSAYQAAAARTVEPSGGEENIAPAGTFAHLVRSTLDQAVEDNKHAEVMSMRAIKGTADMQDVVMAVSNAQMALETVVAVRDKVVSAYQEILQMPI